MSGGEGETRLMNDAEAEEFVIRLLQTHGPMTTMDIETSAAREERRCPDQTVLFLTKMKLKGLLTGEVSIERRGWVWSLAEK